MTAIIYYLLKLYHSFQAFLPFPRYKKRLVCLVLSASIAGFSGPSLALEACPEKDLMAEQSLRKTFQQSSDLNIQAWSHYLKDDFYSDLYCFLRGTGWSKDQIRSNRDVKPILKSFKNRLYQRNTSDALLLILSSMKDTKNSKLKN